MKKYKLIAASMLLGTVGISNTAFSSNCSGYLQQMNSSAQSSTHVEDMLMETALNMADIDGRTNLPLTDFLLTLNSPAESDSSLLYNTLSSCLNEIKGRIDALEDIVYGQDIAEYIERRDSFNNETSLDKQDFEDYISGFESDAGDLAYIAQTLLDQPMGTIKWSVIEPLIRFAFEAQKNAFLVSREWAYNYMTQCDAEEYGPYDTKKPYSYYTNLTNSQAELIRTNPCLDPSYAQYEVFESFFANYSSSRIGTLAQTIGVQANYNANGDVSTSVDANPFMIKRQLNVSLMCMYEQPAADWGVWYYTDGGELSRSNAVASFTHSWDYECNADWEETNDCWKEDRDDGKADSWQACLTHKFQYTASKNYEAVVLAANLGATIQDWDFTSFIPSLTDYYSGNFDPVGDYIRFPLNNNWHEGSISKEGDNWRWSNEAGVSWGLYKSTKLGVLDTDSENPYFGNSNGKTFVLDYGRDSEGPYISAFYFQGERYEAIRESAATVYKHGGLGVNGGYAIELRPGEYTASELIALGAEDEDISSIKVKLGYKVTVYEKSDFTGWSRTYYQDESFLGDINDQVSSIIVEPAPVMATLYQHGGYGGYDVPLRPGQYTLDQLIGHGMKNDDISSLKVTNGFRVRAFEHDNFGGWEKVYTSNTAGVGSANDKFSSIIVEPTP